MMRPLLTGIACSTVVLAGGLAGVFTVQTPAPAVTQSVSSTVQPAHSYTQVIAKTSTTATSPSTLEKSAFDQINKYRAAKGLPALTWNATIAQQARIHSQNMANGKVPYSHAGLQKRGDARAKKMASRGEA